MRKKRVKQETRASQGRVRKETAVRRQLNGSSVAGQSMSEMPPKSQTNTPDSLDGVHTTRPAGASLPRTQQSVPVKGLDGKPLMPTTPWRAEKWIKSGKATPYWSHGVFCVRLNVESGKKVQPIAVGIDPGSKRESFSVKSEAKTYLNIQAEAVTWVGEAVKTRKMMRRQRRQRKTPCRSPRNHRSRGGIPPSTKARWQWKLRIAAWLCKLFPVDCFVVEDIRAVTKNQPKWDKSFSPLEIGKHWFYDELEKFAKVELLQGYETKNIRDLLGLKKTYKKLEEVFSSHCIDSWVLANWYTGGHLIPDNENILFIAPIKLHRRKLHMLQPAKGGIRRSNGGTRSLGFKRGSLVKHPEFGLVYVGGVRTGSKRISLHSLETGERVYQIAKPEDCKFLSYNAWKVRSSSISIG